MLNGITKRLAGAALLGILTAGVAGCTQEEAPPSTTVVTPSPAPASKDTTVVVPSGPASSGPPGPAGAPGPPGPAGAPGTPAPK